MKTKAKAKPRASLQTNSSLPDVLTLAETAAFLRLSKAQIRQLVAKGKLPGRQIGQDYRFLRDSLMQWLDGQKPNPNAFMEAFGAFKDDDTLLPMLHSIYEARGRPEDGDLERNGS